VVSSGRRQRVAALILGSALVLSGCSIIGGATPSPLACGSVCDPATLNFMTCAQSQSSNLSTDEKQRFEASIARGVVGGGGVVELSKTVVETKLSDVALEIVRGCLELSRGVAKPAEVGGIDQQIRTLQGMLDAQSQGTIVLDPTHGPYGQVIGVTGANWGASMELEISAGPAKVRTTTAADGTFATTIQLDPRFEGVSGGSQTIRVSPVKASTQFDASALYTIDH
jgi:hypothetical protein